MKSGQEIWDLPDGPMVRTRSFHCKGNRFDPWSGNEDPTCCQRKKKKKSQSIKKKTRSPSSRIELGERTQMYI